MIEEPPVCPDCGRPRMTSCPCCKTASTHFPFSTGPEHRFDDAPPMLVCTTCDEPFRPVYLKICEWCGHEFADGSMPPALPAPREPIEFNPRLIVALAGIVAVFVGVIGYFAWLLRR